MTSNRKKLRYNYDIFKQGWNEGSGTETQYQQSQNFITFFYFLPFAQEIITHDNHPLGNYESPVQYQLTNSRFRIFPSGCALSTIRCEYELLQNWWLRFLSFFSAMKIHISTLKLAKFYRCNDYKVKEENKKNVIMRFAQPFFFFPSVKYVGCAWKRLSVILRVRAEFSAKNFSSFISTYNSQLHLHTFSSLSPTFYCWEGRCRDTKNKSRLGWITNNHMTESGEWENVKIQFQNCVCKERHNFSSDSCGNFSAFIFVSSRTKSYANIRAT